MFGSAATPGTERPHGWAPAPWTIWILVLVAGVLRFFKLGARGFGDEAEMFTLRDSITTTWLDGPRPLLFFLNHHLVAPWHPLDEFGLRLLPAVFGTAAILLLYWATTRIVSRRAAWFAALVLMFHPWHVYWSQFGRYYALVFAAAAVFPAAAYLAWRDRRLRWLLVSVLSAILGVLAHPSFIFLIGAVGVWAMVVAPRTRVVTGGSPSRRWVGMIAGGVVALAIAFYLAPMFRYWYHQEHAGVHRGVVLLLSYFEGLSLTFVLFGAAGLVWLWLSTDRMLAAFLTCVLVLPLVGLAVVSYLVPVYNSYLLATAPSFFITTGYFFDQLAGLRARSPAATLVTATCLTVLLVVSFPRLWSHYRDGTDPDFRATGAYVSQHASRGDVVLSDQPTLLGYYAPALTVRALERRPEALHRTLAEVRGLSPSPTLWIVALRLWRGGFNDRDLSGAAPWVLRHCRLQTAFGRAHLDYKQEELQVYRCAAADSPTSDRLAVERP